jgi:hypothetical protein
VVTVIAVLPLATPLGTSAKFTAFGAAITLSDEFSVAPRVTPAILELICALAADACRNRIRNAAATLATQAPALGANLRATGGSPSKITSPNLFRALPQHPHETPKVIGRGHNHSESGCARASLAT